MRGGGAAPQLCTKVSIKILAMAFFLRAPVEEVELAELEHLGRIRVVGEHALLLQLKIHNNIKQLQHYPKECQPPHVHSLSRHRFEQS